VASLNAYRSNGEVDRSQFKEPRVLGLDEIWLLKGHRDFVTIVSARDDRAEPVVLAALEGRENHTVIAFLQSIPEELRATVSEVCTDIYEGFANAVKEVLPRAKVVADRFHVSKQDIGGFTRNSQRTAIYG